MAIRAFAARRAGGPLEPFTYEPGPLREGEVEIQITHCGICHSDVHLVDGEWGEHFPLVPGHEIVGTVVQGGGFAPGDRVGVGWQRSSCGRCEHCLQGEETLCRENQATCVGHYGGFADSIRIDGRFVFAIPEALPSAEAAPLMCGGATVFSPLYRLDRRGARVAVIGIGGLGHLALQFASALGHEVTAVSRRADKEDEARSFGATAFLNTAPASGSFDLVLNTAHAAPDMALWLGALAPKGHFVQLGAPQEPLAIPSTPLITGRRCVCGSAIGDPAVIRAMLAFAGEHGVRAQVEVAPMTEADAALGRTRRNEARYRMVLTGASGT